MRRIFTHNNFDLKKIALPLAAILISASSMNAQCPTVNCGPIGVQQDFQSYNANKNFASSGFSTPDGTFAIAGTGSGNRSLQTENNAGTKTLLSPTYIAPQGVFSFRFAYAKQNTSSVLNSITVNIITTSGVVYSCVITPTIPSNNTSYFDHCMSINPTAEGFAGQAFRIQFVYSISGTGNVGAHFDNFGTLSPDGGELPGAFPLPVKFESFTARKGSNVVNLTWAISAEEGITDYLVERSADGREFSTIGSVKAGATQYNFTDAKMLGGSSYYRIKAIEPNAAPTFSKIVMVNGDAIGSIKTFPMPVRNNLTVEHGVVEGGVITLISESGRTISSVRVAPGTSQTQLDMTAATPGMYVVRVADANGNISTSKIVKQ